MAVSIVLDGDSIETQTLAQSVVVDSTANGQDTLRMTVPSYDASYRPDLDKELTIEDGSEVLFGGIVTGLREHGLNGDPTTAIHTTVEATDFNIVAQERYAIEDFPSQTLKQRLTTLVDDYLVDAGVTLHASQADGPTLEAVSYRYVRIDSILDELSTLTGGYVWDIDFDKALRMYEPGTISAPFNITIPATTWFGDVTVEPTRNDYANRVIVDTGTLASMAEDAGEQATVGRIIEVVVSAPPETTQDQADALAAGYLAQRLVTLFKVTYQTRTAGLRPGMTQVITVPQRNINNTYLITDISTSYQGAAGWLRRVTAIEGLVYQTGWRETYKQWSRGGGVSSAGFVGGVGGSTNLRFAYPLTGSQALGVRSSTPTWVPATATEDSAVAGTGAVQIQVNTVSRGTLSATVVLRLKVGEAGNSVQARIFDVTANLACSGTSSSVTATEWETVTFTATLTAGSHFYELQLLPGTANLDVFGVGYLE